MLIITSSYRFSCHTYRLKSPHFLCTQQAEFKKHGPRNWLFQTEGSLVNKLIRLNCAPNDASYLGNVNDLKFDHSNKYEEKDNQVDEFEEAKERIRESFGKIELSPSCYDTAWVAMVPSRHSQKEPCFPQCLDWIIENQREDGSWGLNPSHPLLVKDSLSSTLACLFALSKWGVGDKQVQRGLGFIETNSWAVHKKDQISSVGFEIIFASMVKYAKKLNLNLPLDSEIINLVIHKRDSTIERALQNDFKGNLANLEYMGEGFGELCDWKEIIMLHQRQNGSLFDSPATTAAALIYHQHDQKCFEYLSSILKQHKNWVPTIYPTKMHSFLYLVDTLQCLGVDRYFKTEIKEVLDETYRLWQQKDEHIFSNVTHCAMAFRLLRMSNYQVSSDDIEELVDEEHCFSIRSKKLTSHDGIIELYKTSQIAMHGKDHILDKIRNWTGTFMQQRLLNNDFLDRKSKKEVEFALRKFYVTYDRVENRRYIEAYEVNNFRILKAAYRPPNFNNKDLLRFSVLDFNLCQAQHQQELQQLKRWFEDCRVEQVGFSQHYLYTSYFLIAAFLFEPEFSEARLAFAKTAMLLTLVDDFFDGFVSKDELFNIIQLVERWDQYSTVQYHSERVKILFSALYMTVEELAAKANIRQGRCVKVHLINLWIDLLKHMLIESEWWRSKTTPSIEEYLSIACVSIGVKCVVLTTQYLLGPKLPYDLTQSFEINALWNSTAIVARLLNDIHTYKREQSESSPNMISILIAQSNGTISEEEAIIHIKEMLENKRRELLCMVVTQRKGSQLEQVFKDLFWKTCKLVYSLHAHGDEFRFPQEVKIYINQVLYKPLNHSQ